MLPTLVRGPTQRAAITLAAVTALGPLARPAVTQSAAATHRPPPTAHRFFSPALGARKRVVVYLPPSYARDRGRRYPVLYYLHGMWGDESDWERHGRLPLVMDSLARRGAPEAIVVMPDGDDGWYTTWNMLASLADCPSRVPATEPAAAYCVPWARYDDYIARDLVAWVDSTFRTVADRRHRAIAGLSMGGYGAVALALAYPEQFAAAASHSGVLSPLLTRDTAGTPARPTGGELERGWGPRYWPYLRPAFGRDTIGWWARDPARLARRLRERAPALTPALFADVGTADPFLVQSRAFRDSLVAMGVRHRYAEWAGGHDWEYWRAHLGESIAWLLGEMDGSR